MRLMDQCLGYVSMDASRGHLRTFSFWPFSLAASGGYCLLVGADKTLYPSRESTGETQEIVRNKWRTDGTLEAVKEKRKK